MGLTGSDEEQSKVAKLQAMQRGKIARRQAAEGAAKKRTAAAEPSTGAWPYNLPLITMHD